MSTRTVRAVRVYRFAGFELDVRAAELRQGGEKIRLQEQPYRILTMLLEHPGEVVLRDEICKRLWPNGTVVEASHGINAAILRLREALGDSAAEPRFIETVARRGYRFRVTVETEMRRSGSGQKRASLAGTDSGELAPGQTLGHFCVEEKLGRGGMGVVYRAIDLNLGRAVALKLLAPEMAGDPAAMDRFARESRTASALNHPNICTVYAVEECAGQPVIVMELIEGRTLESILADRAMTVAEALPLAIQMAAAVEAAHRKGIVHRDLKPANIMVTEHGVKVLDFGLAKHAAASNVTRTGSLVGTPHYMAPERFRGRDSDARSDVYSLGAVLREMVRGEMGALEPAVRRALQPDAAERWQSAGDWRAALECVAAAGAAPKVPIRRQGTPPWGRLAAGLSALAATALVLATIGRPVEPTQERYTKSPAEPVHAASFTTNQAKLRVPERLNLSPDGRQLAYANGDSVYVRALDNGEEHVAASGLGAAGTPFWSPDGKSIAFAANKRLYTAPAAGGVATSLAPVNTSAAGAWGPSGTILIGEVGDGLLAVSAGSGASRKLTRPDVTSGETRHLLPQFLPGGKRYLYVAGSDVSGSGMIYAGSLDGAAPVQVVQSDSGAVFVPRSGSNGYLVFERGGFLLAQAFDAATVRVTGEAIRLGGPVTGSPAAAAVGVTIANFSATPSTLAYRVAEKAPSMVRTISFPPQRTASESLVILKDWMARLKR